MPETAEDLNHADKAHATLLRAIATCQLPPGSVFNEREQAAKLGMSRTPFREALHRLEVQGLIETRPKRGVYVALIDVQELRDHAGLREAIEVESVRPALEANQLDFDDLDRRLEAMEKALESGDDVDYLRLDEDFHLSVVEAAGNRVAHQVAEQTWIHLNRIRFLEQLAPGVLGAAHHDHTALADALRQGDAARARRVVRRHIAGYLRVMDDQMGRLPSAFVRATPDPHSA